MLLKNKLAVITGANRGIGRAITETFAAHGANVIACMREINDERQSWLTSLADQHGMTAQAVSLDLADEASVKTAVRQIASLAPRIDILVNNAGVASGAIFQMTSMTELRRLFEINFFSQILLTQGLARAMARHKTGSIINIASTAAMVADAGTLAYGSSKAAFARATQSMATELGASGIRVNAIAPGVTRTDMYDQMTEAAREKLIASSAMKRAVEPQDVANMALFLASDLSTVVTGQILRVDGGMV
ncbi:SDR family NAD(P)-dependent oxidoreductase [Paraburkholderia phenoliruptrix]|uniref:SDR family NAD(P)-dependent oxidoreductase n=1 Tax=Paraburkholderia phenoliruptrix TaxID=252970 RepID=UPI00285EC4FD|nr:SDR family oxidoreductase [Paraburkholderia phenoliruptrix]MDR6421061.1 3-oxoacyl-[acyl-carrier protein] reductase [Paraburkholderia phenoliruptrix]